MVLIIKDCRVSCVSIQNLNILILILFSFGLQEKSLKATVYRISGSVPAGNYIQFPKASSQSLGLTGHYLYILFKPVATKYFVVHLDVATDDGVIVRVSFSNLFKEFKSTSTWLQFPFISTPPAGSVEDATSAKLPFEGNLEIFLILNAEHGKDFYVSVHLTPFR